MRSLLLPVARNRQPQTRPTLNKKLQKELGIRLVFLGSHPVFDAAEETRPWTLVGPDRASYASGIAKVCSKTKYATKLQPLPANAPGWSIASVFVPVTYSAGNRWVAGFCEAPGNSTVDRSIYFPLAGNGFSAYLYDTGAKEALCVGTVAGGIEERFVATASTSQLRGYRLSAAAAVGYVESSTTTVTNSGYTGYSTPEFCVGYAGAVPADTFDNDFLITVYADRPWTPQEAKRWLYDPYFIFEEESLDYWIPDAGGGSHAASGDLIGPGSTISGTATQFRAHAASGDLVGSGAAITGTATQFRAHATNGDLIGPGAAITGSAAQSSPGAHATSGALVGPGATITGTVTHVGTHDASGALIGAGAAVTGTAAHIIVHATSGDLIGPGAAITGSATSSGSTTLTAADLAAIDALITAQLPNIAAAVLAAYVEGTTTVQQALRMYDAVLGGKVSGAGTSTETFRDLADTKDRIVATVDSSGNRTVVTRDLS